ncbi:tRNA lysidine(34) synthetase TilS [Winogradskyella alexanderae]|uniref:tRNA(Ile)-lysidine synthase n=1 Tax=Winogradskyella alexanderae TaxID=2877123 RepID=A0ABS7XUR6_9FLAO|nr:tRNA lysidine(34) synthetase TilS [Winogradskyella alexanderae]MCA0133149.1 tRNA lysidine(34) synthetase TilS [Winogradskyella alexanderae]
MQEAFNENTKKHLEFLLNSRIIIAVSGGIDSVVLSHLCADLGLNFALAHCNFNLRGTKSDADEEFVMDLGDKLETEVFVQNFETISYAKDNKLSIQMAARELRYNWLNELAEQLQFDYILTAHHADDNLETFLINFLRGTGLNGLTGIPEINGNIVRPLLSFSRKEIANCAHQKHIKWREDESNSTRKYLRNKLRHEVVPVLKKINPQLLEGFKNTLENLNDTADIVEESLNAVAKRAIVSIDEDGVTYKILEFKKVNNSKAYLFEMFKAYGFTEWNDIVGLLDAETGKYVKSNSHKLTKHRQHLILTDLDKELPNNECTLIDETNMSSETPIGTLTLEDTKNAQDNTSTTIYVDRAKLKFPLKLRLWQKGEYIYPLGMQGKKKLSKFLKDEKLTPFQKDTTWVLESNGDIIWVVGRRADDRFKVTKHTDKILKIEIL